MADMAGPFKVEPSLFFPQNQDSDRLCFERSFWRRGIFRIAGTDEAGRGPLAGPVVAAAVVLPRDCDTSLLHDSKKLSRKRRTKAIDFLQTVKAEIAVGLIDHQTIDELNILQASLLAMKKALTELAAKYGIPDQVLVDGKFEVPYPASQTAIIKGDAKSASIAAASIVAKEARDAIMAGLHEKYPQYNFIKNQGYPTKEHKAAIARYGPCPFHRLSFNGVKQFA